ncbi:MAG TPA: ABC transporter substrate-binding protein [Candidatus Binatia bacterium]|jgi:phospholipid transport system substrate-binding protein|nr:ABC transporter substrate-binding protein [Candidatus Binatia bacterium]
MAFGSTLLATVFVALALLWGGSSAIAGMAEEQVKETVNRVVEILRDPALRTEDKIAQRREMLRQAIFPRFDFSEMARRSLGSHWKNQKARQEEFVAVFSDFVETAYVGKVESFKDEKILFVRERIDQGFADVDTKVVPSKGEPFSVNYKLHMVGTDWKVYDVVIENISLVNNYRSQFNRILANASFDELLKKLRDKRSGMGS